MSLTEQSTPSAHEAGLTGECLCALCAEQGGSCCATDPATGHLSFPLSLPEWRRLKVWSALATEAVPADGAAFAEAERRAKAAAAGLAPLLGSELNAVATALDVPAGENPPVQGDACCQAWPNSTDFILSMNVLFAKEKSRISALFPEGGSHFSLRLRRDGACVFLGEGGCRLPRAVRPWYCLLFPAWIMDGRAALFTAQGCLIAERALNPAHGVRLMGVSYESLKDIFARLRKDWGFAP